MRMKVPGEGFFEHVISRTEDILSQNSFARSERHTSEVFTHTDLLFRENGKITKSVGKHTYRRN